MFKAVGAKAPCNAPLEELCSKTRKLSQICSVLSMLFGVAKSKEWHLPRGLLFESYMFRGHFPSTARISRH